MGWKCFLLLFETQQYCCQNVSTLVCKHRKNAGVSPQRGGEMERFSAFLKHLTAHATKPLLQIMSHFHNHAQQIKVKNSGGPLDNQTWQTEGKTAPLAKVQLCEYKNQNLGIFVVVSHLNTKFDCSVARQNFSLLATAHDYETGLLGSDLLF